MSDPTLLDLRVSVNDRRAFDSLEDYRTLARTYLSDFQRFLVEDVWRLLKP